MNAKTDIPLKSCDQEMLDFVNSLRVKAGLVKVKTPDDYKKEISELRTEIRILKQEICYVKKMEERREIAVRRESERVIDVLHTLTFVHDPDLKRAVSLVLYWDKFSWLACDIVEMMCADRRIKAFFDQPHDFGNLKCMQRCVGTEEFVAAPSRPNSAPRRTGRITDFHKPKGKERTMSKNRKINQRMDEPENPYSYQITFRTTRELSGAWSSLRGLCKKYGHDEKSPELFREVVIPAMKKYISAKGYLDKAKADHFTKDLMRIFR